MIERVLAGLGLAVCLLLWLGMALGPVRRRRVIGWPQRLWRSLRTRRQSRREAEILIERARRGARSGRDGTARRPESFNGRDHDDGA